MTRLFFSLFFLVQSLTAGAFPVSSAISVEGNRSAVLCQAGVFPIDPQDCLPLGPSSYLTQMSSIGMNLPLAPVPSKPLDPTLGIVPFDYAVLGEEPTPVYANLEDAISGNNEIRQIAAGGLRYISYLESADTERGRFFKLHDNTWVQVSSRISIPASYPGGIELTMTPKVSFGWILPFAPTIETKRTPGYSSQDNSGHLVNQYQLIQVYATQVVGEDEWYLIAPNEWIDGRYIGRVIPSTTPPAGVENGRWVEVNLAEQTLAVYEQNQMVFATLIASGLEPFYTKPGLFQIQRKLDSTPMSGSFEADRSDFYYLEDVPWTMYYDDARALHGAYWRTAFGYPQSHGCVNLSPPDAHWLFDWAKEGDWVYVWDPSGLTPTDPSFYGDGGA